MTPALIATLVLSATPSLPGNGKTPEIGIPFACGKAFPVSQAHDTGSHQHNDVWAWDFRMPVGTPIVAAEDGLVRMARGDSDEGGCDPKFAGKTNYVVVDHGTGLETQYLHFSSVIVTRGQRVKKGELLGYSGSTGWSCGPHLHFKVATATGRGWNNPSVPAQIEGYGDPQRGVWIQAPSCDAPEVMMAGADGKGSRTRSAAGERGEAAAQIVQAVEKSAVADAAESTSHAGGLGVTPAEQRALPILDATPNVTGAGGADVAPPLPTKSGSGQSGGVRSQP